MDGTSTGVPCDLDLFSTPPASALALVTGTTGLLMWTVMCMCGGTGTRTRWMRCVGVVEVPCEWLRSFFLFEGEGGNTASACEGAETSAARISGGVEAFEALGRF
jgi:hypothetical protein